MNKYDKKKVKLILLYYVTFNNSYGLAVNAYVF